MSGNNNRKGPIPEVLTGAALAGAASSGLDVREVGLEVQIQELRHRLAEAERAVTELNKKLAGVQAEAAKLPQLVQMIVAHDQRLAQFAKHRHDDQGECVVRLG